MEFFHEIVFGFQACLQPINVLYCFIGVFIGTLIGVLPGIGSVGTMAILFPVTFKSPPLAAVIMLAGIYYGAMYGGSTTSILVNIPGEAASVMTALDGYQMAVKGRAGAALGISAFGSFIAGSLGLIGLMVLAHPLASMALSFGPPEYFSLMILGLLILIYIAQKSLLKAIIMGGFGLLISFTGLDLVSGRDRFTWGIEGLLQGIDIVPIVMGFFGIAEIMKNLEEAAKKTILVETKIRGILPTISDWKDAIWPILRGTLAGFFLGILPGGGASLSTYVSYAIEKRTSRHPERFGTGAIEGVAAPESANNAASSGAFVPLMTLGIPSNPVMAMLFAGLLMHNITPGPLMLAEHPDVFWGLITSMYLGNIMLLLLNLPLIGMWVQITKIPFRFLFPLIILFCVIGAYSVNSTTLDLWLMLVFGLLGYIMKKCDYEPQPLILAYVLGPRLEQAMRQSLMISNGKFSIFLTRPVSLICLLIGTFLLVTAFTGYAKRKRVEIVKEEG